ncbi:hypothetical protein [Rhodococcus sp. H29-C3]|uniref:hypothetical protein n=1 Tax=Rhodococcus sp. H29-C3 TaxID=3046307 RepID=UPI0024BA3000|nr:hypothetical protein [Rhodococcus sp. H29-C3]MDJ0361546.1 hypothetical protein [Rhodococcus sp. H29-C3]
MELSLIIVTAIAAVAAAIFAAPAGLRDAKAFLRPPPFTLTGRTPTDVVVLTRTGRKPVQLRGTWIFDYGQIPVNSANPHSDWRTLRKGDYLVLNVSGVMPGDELLVDYRVITKKEAARLDAAPGDRELRNQLELEREGQVHETWTHSVI